MAKASKRPARPVAAPARPAPCPPNWHAPAEALPLWLSSDGQLCIGLPGEREGVGHTVILSDDPIIAFKLLRDILTARAVTPAPTQRLNTPSAPSQAILQLYEAAMKRGSQPKRPEFDLDAPAAHLLDA